MNVVSAVHWLLWDLSWIIDRGYPFESQPIIQNSKPAVHQQQRALQMKDGGALQGNFFNDASSDEGMITWKQKLNFSETQDTTLCEAAKQHFMSAYFAQFTVKNKIHQLNLNLRFQS